HGLDALFSPGAVFVSNTVYDNTSSGITLESHSSGATIENNILADNGTSRRGNVWADASSISSTSLDYDLVYQSGAGAQFTWGGTRYTTPSALASATGQESHGLKADPHWADPAHGNFTIPSG